MIFVADLHMGKGDGSDDFSPEAEEAYLEFLDATRCHQHFIVGDGQELWQATRSEVLAAHPRVFTRWSSLCREVTHIPGNHDPDDQRPDRMVVESGGRLILVLHGHQFDPVNKTRNGLGRYVTLIVGFLETHVHKDADIWLGNVYASSWLSEFYNIAERRAAQYDQSVAALAKELACSAAVYSHTHLPSLNDVDGVLVASCGCWTKRFAQGYPYVQIVDGSIQLKWWG